VKPTDNHQVESFPPQIAADCGLLILGTVPSVVARAAPIYGHKHNLFWPFMGELFDAGPELAYAGTHPRLQRRGIGIWDVLERCERRGSLDSAIVPGSEVANDIRLCSPHASGHPGDRAEWRQGPAVVPPPHRAAARCCAACAHHATRPAVDSPANASIPRARSSSNAGAN
jgi:hypothetical protein